jgi:toxin FitB
MKGFLLDTNVISELVKPQPDTKVTAWISSIDERLLCLSTLTLGEIRKGIESLPITPRRLALEGWLELDLPDRFYGRILSVDDAVADRWGRMTASAASKKCELPVIEGLLAATALQHDLILVTRNTRDLQATGAAVLNPWV